MRPGRFKVLGIPVDAVQISGAVERMMGWIESGDRGRFVAVTGMHGVTEALGDPETREALLAADLVVPDGMPLVWLGRLSGHPLRRRVYGPELMLEFFASAARRGIRHFLDGGAPGVADALAARLAGRFPGTIIAGTHCPPFRSLTAAERFDVVEKIVAAKPDVVWVGLSTPKQEKWIQEMRRELPVPLLVGVGAAFDMNSGRVRQAPEWMRENGFEWLFRLLQEPRRLWRRYLVQGPRFVFNVTLERARLRSFD